MKNTIFPIFIIAFLLQACNFLSNYESEHDVYFSQETPGLIPQVFFPDLLSRSKPEWAFCVGYNNEGTEFYFVTDGKKSNKESIAYKKYINGKWLEPELLSVNNGFPTNNFGLSPDGKKIFFRSWRPIPAYEIEENKSSLWYAEKKLEGWDEPKPVVCGNNYIIGVGQPSLAANGNLYFATGRDDSYGSSDIYMAKFENGSYSTPVNLGSEINTQYGEADLCVSPDEKFIVVTCWGNPENVGGSDLYVSFKNSDGNWSKLINMGEAINLEYNESAPTLSPDGKYLFYVSVDVSGEIAKCNTYWVSTQIIETLNKEFNKNNGVHYQGQKPQALTPIKFARGNISTKDFDEYGCSFSPDMKSFLFTRTLKNPRRHQMFQSEYKNGAWVNIEKLVLDSVNQTGEPIISPDGKILLFGKMIKDGTNKTMRSEIWFAENEEGKWTNPKFLTNGMYATISNNHNVYFTDVSKGFDKPIIKFGKFKNGKLIDIMSLPKSINEGSENAHPFIHPDEKYVIFDSDREGGYGNFDLYISFKIDDRWSKAVNLGEKVNTEHYEALPYVSPDGKYLYFCKYTDQGDIYRIDSRIIDDLKSKYIK